MNECEIVCFCHVVKCNMIQRKIKLKFTNLVVVKYRRFNIINLSALYNLPHYCIK